MAVVEEAPATVTYEEHYCEARQRDPELDRSLKVLEEAQQRLGQGADRQDVIRSVRQPGQARLVGRE